MRRVYIAGPISGGTLETLANIRRGLKAAAKAVRHGYAVFSPHLDFSLNLVADDGDVLTVDEYQANSMAWLEVSSEVWVLSGYEKSNGTKREIARANELKIPVKYLDEPKKKGAMKKNDGAHQKEAPLSGARFIDNGDGTISDTVTGLQWVKQPELIISGPCNWSKAIETCKSLKYAGHSDWRLPNIKELMSIVDYGRSSPAVDTKFFPTIRSERYWSGSSYAPYSDYAWYVYFNGGDVYNHYKDDASYVLLVRSSQ